MCKTPRGGHRDSGELQATCSCARPCCCPGQACCYSIAGRGERDPQTLLLSPLLSLGVSSELEVIGEHPQLCLELSEEYFFADRRAWMWPWEAWEVIHPCRQGPIHAVGCRKEK